jgi:hypothetical protein
MKGFLAVESSWVQGPHIVCMQISWCLPRLAITQLRVWCIATRQSGRLTLFDLQCFRAIELYSGVTLSPRWSRCRCRSHIASPRRCRVINCLQIGGISHHRWCAILVCCRVQLVVRLWHQCVVEASWGQFVWGHIQDLGFKDSTWLLSYCFTEMLVVYADLGTVTCIARNNFWLLLYLHLFKCFVRQIIINSLSWSCH